MSETLLFVIGTIVFAITVYGAVMAGGLALTRVELHQDDQKGPRSPDGEQDEALPLRVEY
jgi:hypothetical protein